MMKKELWYKYDFSYQSDSLLVGFGSAEMFDKDNNKKFEWNNYFKFKLSHLNFNRLFVADVNNSWYHTRYYGLNGDGPHVLKNFLNEKIEECGATKTLYLGTSMGGYGAILLGCLTNATQVMAFSPQTWLTPDRYKKASLLKKFSTCDVDYNLTDLKKVLEETPSSTIYKIWYGEDNSSDALMAKRISNINNVILKPVPTSVHGSFKLPIRSGEVRTEIEKFLYK